MKTLLGLVTVFCLSACVSTDSLVYQGGTPVMGTGGAAKMVDGIEIWMTGTPPRKFQVVGYIVDSRPNRGVPLLTMYHDIARHARQLGGDGVLIESRSVQYTGSLSSGNAFTTVNGNTAWTNGLGISAPLTQRNDTYFVIKYLN